MDLSHLSSTELRALQQQLQTELESRQRESMRAARQQILDIAQQVGLPLAQLMADVVNKPARGKPYPPVPVRYRHPDQPDLQWKGRGRTPSWVLEWEQKHGSLDGLRLNAE